MSAKSRKNDSVLIVVAGTVVCHPCPTEAVSTSRVIRSKYVDLIYGELPKEAIAGWVSEYRDYVDPSRFVIAAQDARNPYFAQCRELVQRETGSSSAGDQEACITDLYPAIQADLSAGITCLQNPKRARLTPQRVFVSPCSTEGLPINMVRNAPGKQQQCHCCQQHHRQQQHSNNTTTTTTSKITNRASRFTSPVSLPQTNAKEDGWEIVQSSVSEWSMGATASPTAYAAPTARGFSKGDDDTICILADLLIPGRGDPIVNAFVGLSKRTGTITHVGNQSSLPHELHYAPNVKVGYLLPGLWDCHSHFTGVVNVDFPDMIMTHPVTCGAAIARGFYDTLMAGFTSVRDCGSWAIEAAVSVDRGIILGPNVYGSGAAIGITGGSCDAISMPVDFVYSRQGVGHDNHWSGTSQLAIADGIEECRRAVRQQIRRGARCIKVITTGGVMSTRDDPKYRQYSDEELRVMVEEATLQGRAVAAHAHGKDGITAAVRAGAHTIEHGSYIDEEAAQLMRDKGVSLVATRHVIEAGLRHLSHLNPETAEKMVQVARSHEQAYKTAVRVGVKIALGTDIAGANPRSETSPGNNGDELIYAVKAGLSPLQAIEAATINSAETLGPQTPKKGLVRVGWDADLIALDEDPLENIKLFASPANIKYVWKGAQPVKAPGKAFWPPEY